MAPRMKLTISEKPIVKQVMSYVFIVIGVLMLAAPASAQVSSGLNELGGKGIVEIGKLSSDAESRWQTDINMFYGRFLTDRVEVGPALNVYKYEGEPASGAVGGFVNYHFGDVTGELVPFAEVAAGQLFGGNDGKPLYLNLSPGVKWFFAKGGGALIASAFYRHLFIDTELTTGANEFGLTVGVAIYFGR